MNSVVVVKISGVGGARHRPSSSSFNSSSSHPLAPVCVFSTCSLCAFLGLLVLDLVKSSTTFHVFVACVCLSTCAMTTVIDPGIVLPKRNTSARASGIEEGKGEVSLCHHCKFLLFIIIFLFYTLESQWIVLKTKFNI